MCGIFGSNSLERFKTLYKLNQSRGDFAYGMLGLSANSDNLLVKGSGLADVDDIFKEGDYMYFLGHTQAPTSSVREYADSTTHPFEYKRWSVAHNGVLSNAEQLQKKYMLRETKVDTDVITSMLDYGEIITGKPNEDDYRSLKNTFEEIRGTFGCWVYNKDTKNTYLVRVGSTLHGNIENGDFTSAQDYERTYKPLEEGMLYQIDGGISPLGKFVYDSPYFVL